MFVLLLLLLLLVIGGLFDIVGVLVGASSGCSCCSWPVVVGGGGGGCCGCPCFCHGDLVVCQEIVLLSGDDTSDRVFERTFESVDHLESTF